MAYAQRYCVPGGAGLANGLTWADAWSWAQSWNDVTADKVTNCAGDFSISTNLTNTVSRCHWVGWKADKSDYATTLADQPQLDFAGLVAGNAIERPGAAGSIVGFEILNTPSWAINTVAADGVTIALNNIHDCANGIQTDDWIAVVLNRFKDITGTFLVDGDNGVRFLLNEVINDTTTGGVNGAFSGLTAVLNYFGGSTNGINSTSTGNMLAVLNTFDACVNGINAQPNTGAAAFLNIFSNNTTGIKQATNLTSNILNNFYNNTTDYDGSFPANILETSLNPSYTNIGADNYNIGEALLQGVALGGLLQEPNIGAAQARAAAAGGGLLVHPGMSGGMRG